MAGDVSRRAGSIVTWTPPNKRMHPTADTLDVINLRRAARRVMRGVRCLAGNDAIV